MAHNIKFVGQTFLTLVVAKVVLHVLVFYTSTRERQTENKKKKIIRSVKFKKKSCKMNDIRPRCEKGLKLALVASSPRKNTRKGEKVRKALYIFERDITK